MFARKGRHGFDQSFIIGLLQRCCEMGPGYCFALGGAQKSVHLSRAVSDVALLGNPEAGLFGQPFGLVKLIFCFHFLANVIIKTDIGFQVTSPIVDRCDSGVDPKRTATFLFYRYGCAT